MARGGIPASPLPQRDGVDAMRLRMPQSGPWATVRDHLVERIPALEPGEIDRMLAAGEFVDETGRPVGPDAPFVPRSAVWVHREFPVEVPVPYDLPVLHQDARILVVDKPPFLATMPRGAHIRETALTRLRRTLDQPRLAPAHRLDRLTTGVLLFTTEQRWRGAYQQVFAAGHVTKQYAALAPLDERFTDAQTVRLHLAKPHGALQAVVHEDRPPNTCTTVQLTGPAPGRPRIGIYALHPHTGRTHQLRATMAWLGLPIVGDPLYPVVRDVPDGDFRDPLQLYAVRLAFRDPIDGQPRDFRSRWGPDTPPIPTQ